MTKEEFRIAVIPGDGIGEEVVGEGMRILKHLTELDGTFGMSFKSFPWSCNYYLENGRMMPNDALPVLSKFDGILLGSVGYPTVPDHVSLWGLLIPIRRGFDQYVNYRPVRLLRGIESPLRKAGPGDIDFVIVRENTEGEYSNIGGRFKEGTENEFAVQSSIFTRLGVERIMKYAFELAIARSKKSGRKPSVVAATKSNGINITMPFWDEIFRSLAADYPGVETHIYHVDALSSYLVTRPESFDVIVASNLFGDILSDLGAAIVGGIGVAPSANINPERTFPSTFEPVHGSAPDIANMGIANPIGELWSVSLMLEHFGKTVIATKIIEAIEEVTSSGIKTSDLGGSSSTTQVVDAVIREIGKLLKR